MKEAFYFPHDNNAHSDPKLMSVFMETGLRGIGLYWILVELMHQQENGMITFEQYKHYVKWYSSHEDSGTRITDQLMNTCLTNGLFCKTDDGFIYSKRVLQNKEFREELSKKRSIAGKKSAEVRAKATSVEQNGTHVEQGKERKGKENKEKKNNTYTESFEIFWKEYPNRVGKPDALKKYKEQEHSDIMDGLTRWKEFWDYSETEPRFIPHPATWLNQERYKDEPPETKTKTISVINKF